MEIALIIGALILAIFFGILLKDFWERQQRGEIVIFRNNYDLFFNAIVYILPALVFFIEKPGFNNLLCYILLCIGFTIFMCISAWDSNYTTGEKITAAVIKIIAGIEVPLVLAFIVLLLLLIFGGKESKNNRNRTNYNTNYNYNRRRNRW